MRKPIFGFLILLTTFAALAAALYWALAVMLTMVDVLGPVGMDDTYVIKTVWHFRLIQPEWVGSPPEYIRWSIAETVARLVIVFFAWLGICKFLGRQYRKPRNDGCCQTCGYDLRATPDRCPECGTIPTKVEAGK